jgi:hypothetical protein
MDRRERRGAMGDDNLALLAPTSREALKLLQIARELLEVSKESAAIAALDKSIMLLLRSGNRR